MAEPVMDDYIEVQRAAEALFAKKPDWVTFFRDVLGLGGLVRSKFPQLDDLAQFEQSEVFAAIQQMLATLREQGPVPTNPEDPTRVITVRLPKSLHEALREEAHDHHTSINKLCISKLVQFIDAQMIPDQR